MHANHDESCVGVLTASDAVETEAALFGRPVMLTMPGVVGCHISGSVNMFCSSTDIVLAITKVRHKIQDSSTF